MPVPNNNNFTLINVVNEINPSLQTLQGCFNNAIGNFDAQYVGNKDRLSNFRNYSHLFERWDVRTAVYANKSYNVYAQGNNYDFRLFFSPDGSRMYVSCSYTLDNIFQYNLSTAWDISTANYANKSFNVTAQENGQKSGLSFSSNGHKMYVIGEHLIVYQYALATAWDISTANYASKSFSVFTQTSYTSSYVTFSPDGNKMYIFASSVYQYNLSTPWDVTTAVYANKSFSVAAQEVQPYSMFFSPEGRKMFVVGVSNDEVNQYSLATAWDVSTANFDNKSFMITAPAYPFGFFFSPEGRRMYVAVGAGDIYQFNLYSPAANISTAVYANKSFSVLSQESDPLNVYFSPEGTKMYVIGSGYDRVNQYTLSTPWDVTTASYVTYLSVTSNFTNPRNIFFEPNGEKMYIAGTVPTVQIIQYNLSTPWNLATASSGSVFNPTAQESVNHGLYFSPDGTKMYLLGTVSDTVFQYSLSTPWNLGSASYANKSFSVATQESAPVEIVLSPEGDKMYVLGLGATIFQYNLTTAWDISTASYSGYSFSLSAQESSPRGLWFSAEFNKFYIIGTTTDRIYQYDLP